jgi:hypothetical protein
MMNLKKCALHTAVAMACGLGAQLANAGATISFGEDKYVSVGFGFISSYLSQSNAAANSDRSHDFQLNSTRLYVNASLNKYIKGMLTTEKSGAGGGGSTDASSNMEIIDANVQFQLAPEVSIWAGRFLSPSDRANMAGPYYSGGGGYWASIASRYGWNGGVIGRDDGVAAVTSFMDDHVSVSFGAFNGKNIFRFSNVGAQAYESASSSSNRNLMYAGRVQVDFWDAEPGYYGTGNYYGAKDILAIGVSGKFKKDGAVSATNLTGDYKTYSVDFLLEKKDVGPGTVSVEAAYYYYDTDNVFLAEQGHAYYGSLGYLFQDPVGWGKFMPVMRYQRFNADGLTSSASVNTSTSADTKRFEIGSNYVIAPYNAMISAFYGHQENPTVTGHTSSNDIKVALQMQF